MTPYKRVLLLVGGAALFASLMIAAIFVQTDTVAAQLTSDENAAHNLQTLGDKLLAGVHEQREALDEYLLTGDPRLLARYQQAVADEIATTRLISLGAGNLPGVDQALAGVAAQNDGWRLNVAGPAIAAVQSGNTAAIAAAIAAEIDDLAGPETAITQFVVNIDAVEAELGLRADALSAFRVAATGVGVGIELLAAGLSLWFVRRYGLRVSRDTRRRIKASVERIEIIASLRTLRTQQTPEATAAVIAEALSHLPGVDVAGVYERTADGVLALALVGLPGFPIKTGDKFPEMLGRYIEERSAGGAWAERWSRPSDPSAYDERLAELGIKGRAFAPIQVDGELIGLIGLATSSEEHGRHLVEDLPAVSEFASVAEMILAPALIARRDRAEKRRRIGAAIASTAFRSVFQPIVDLHTGSTTGYEALTRFDDGARPDLTFAAALECGMGMELEIVTLKEAIRASGGLPIGAWLSLNVSPPLLAEADTLIRMLRGWSRSVVLEVTEHEAIDAYAPLREALVRLGPGVRLAVDDTGAGVANFNHLVELRPYFVKVDAGLVHGVDADPSRRAVVVGLIHFAAEAGCKVIAEGIETEAERATLIELGVSLGQGYLLGKPAPAEAWKTEPKKRITPVRRLPARRAKVLALRPAV